ncbi:hypothetical protein EJ05DRAFT_521633 [Pseudovirgaria hyperparasitica]|uniref:CBM1 domain-containing protein n=1 Tax=Pseudovirgaria hyperparasitica TaxID=470096 RepID=A0A6A6VWZ0_9PEZI|nr:uncharacterized protein EJ05DRAFT_521633 [Pseudovirgaria hyperparasitica]KAF2753761.1 hypothetical protein EJ05DRAFT_521633 [Pseudovirgaria hyperparasitica]
MLGYFLLYSAFVGSVFAGTIIWDGRFNDMTSSADLNNWSWANQVGNYQYYIHGSGTVDKYLNLATSYKNPADTGSKQGAKITLDSTAKWNSDMWRTELIPQTTAAINKNRVYYHFSMKRSTLNAPSVNHEHQVNFFESHFTEMKYGWVNGESGTSNPNLQWFVSGQSKWSTPFDAEVWHNVAYEIDFAAGSVSFWHSTGSAALTLTAGPISTSTSSNGADWHLGVLRLPRSGYDTTNSEDWYFSGVYVETGSLTTGVASPGVAGGGIPVVSSTLTNALPITMVPTSTVRTTLITSSKPVVTGTPVAQYARCGGASYTGSTVCVTPYKCVQLNDYYSQCQ